MEESGDSVRGKDADSVQASRAPRLSREVDLLEAKEHRAAPDASGDPDRPRVLVASASVELARYVCQGLGRLDPPVAGFEEHRVHRILDRFHEVLPVLVIVDGDVDEGGGFELCEHLREAAGAGVLRILLLVDGARRHEAARRMTSVGVDGLLWKPFNLSQLAAEATRLLTMPSKSDGGSP
jgi:DNA-binding response OmpR family regulator